MAVNPDSIGRITSISRNISIDVLQ
jgi:hypothetical protein